MSPIFALATPLFLGAYLYLAPAILIQSVAENIMIDAIELSDPYQVDFTAASD